MIRPPRKFRRSLTAHNTDCETFLDWLEATLLLDEDELSQTDIVDYLIEEQLYVDQGFAWEYVSLRWAELKRRLSWLGSNSPIEFVDKYAVRELDWQDVPAHSFCLVVSLGPLCHGWREEFGNDYTDQGRLFELITKSAMETKFSGWNFLHTGWRRNHTAKLPEVIDDLISAINEKLGNIDDYASHDANEAGLDLVWHLPFVDHRSGAPVYLAQCASGLNWSDKISEPNLADWRKIIDFAAVPNKAFSLPFALADRELRLQSNRGQGLLLDRYRLLANGYPESDWVPGELQNEIIDWLKPRIDWIMNH